MESARVTSKGQITIPLSIRKDLRINEGDIVTFVKNGNGYTLETLDITALEKIRNSLGDIAQTLELHSLEDVAVLVRELHTSYVQAQNGELIDKDTAIKGLKDRYKCMM